MYVRNIVGYSAIRGRMYLQVSFKLFSSRGLFVLQEYNMGLHQIIFPINLKFGTNTNLIVIKGVWGRVHFWELLDPFF